MAEQFSGKVEIKNSSSNTTVELDGNVGDAVFKTTTGDTRLRIDGSEGDIKAYRKYGRTTREVYRLDASSAYLSLGTTSNAGDIIVRDASNKTVFNVAGTSAAVYAGAAGNPGDLYIRDNSGSNALVFNGQSAALYIGRSGNEGDLRIRDAGGREVFIFDGNSSALYIGANGNEGDIQLRDGAGRTVMNMNGDYAALYIGAAGNEGDVILRDNNGNDSIHLDGGSGDIILRNADAAEHFDVVDSQAAKPGTAMVLNPEGKLEPCRTPYDHKAVGIVAGAGAYKPGIVLDKQENETNRVPISMIGKVACYADATPSPIQVGDLLTTSEKEGHLMKATDLSKSTGAILGKALTPLHQGSGMINLLVMQR